MKNGSIIKNGKVEDSPVRQGRLLPKYRACVYNETWNPQATAQVWEDRAQNLWVKVKCQCGRRGWCLLEDFYRMAHCEFERYNCYQCRCGKLSEVIDIVISNNATRRASMILVNHLPI